MAGMAELFGIQVRFTARPGQGGAFAEMLLEAAKGLDDVASSEARSVLGVAAGVFGVVAAVAGVALAGEARRRGDKLGEAEDEIRSMRRELASINAVLQEE